MTGSKVIYTAANISGDIGKKNLVTMEAGEARSLLQI